VRHHGEEWRQAIAAEPARRSRVALAQFRLTLLGIPRGEARETSLAAVRLMHGEFPRGKNLFSEGTCNCQTGNSDGNKSKERKKPSHMPAKKSESHQDACCARVLWQDGAQDGRRVDSSPPTPYFERGPLPSPRTPLWLNGRRTPTRPVDKPCFWCVPLGFLIGFWWR